MVFKIEQSHFVRTKAIQTSFNGAEIIGTSFHENQFQKNLPG